MRKRLMLAGIVTAVMLATACNKSTGSVADASADMPSETSGENLVSTESQETETVTKADNKETSTAKETTKTSVKDSATTESTKKNTETTTAQETSSARAVVTETTTSQETTSEEENSEETSSVKAVVTETTTAQPETASEAQTPAPTEAPTPALTEAPSTQPETTTQAPTEAPAPQPETTTQAPTETPAQTEAPATQPETTTEAQEGPKSDEELLAEITDVHYGTRAEVNGNVYWYEDGWNKSQGAWNGPTLNVIMGDVRNGMETYATENSVLNNMNEQAAQYSWSTGREVLGWYDDGYVRHAWTYCNENPCNWHNH